MVIGDGLIVIPEYFKKFVKEKIILDDLPNQFLVVQGIRKNTLTKSLENLTRFVVKHGSEIKIINHSTFFQVENELREVAVFQIIGLVSWKIEDLLEEESKGDEK